MREYDELDSFYKKLSKDELTCVLLYGIFTEMRLDVNKTEDKMEMMWIITEDPIIMEINKMISDREYAFDYQYGEYSYYVERDYPYTGYRVQPHMYNKPSFNSGEREKVNLYECFYITHITTSKFLKNHKIIYGNKKEEILGGNI